jgi:hypothetical protein
MAKDDPLLSLHSQNSEEKRAKLSDNEDDFANLVNQTLAEAVKKPKNLMNGKMMAGIFSKKN